LSRSYRAYLPDGPFLYVGERDWVVRFWADKLHLIMNYGGRGDDEGSTALALEVDDDA
jgi:hypothetical protein